MSSFGGMVFSTTSGFRSMLQVPQTSTLPHGLLTDQQGREGMDTNVNIVGSAPPVIEPGIAGGHSTQSTNGTVIYHVKPEL